MEHNFIDKITPLIELLHTKEYKVKLIKCMHNYNYETDKNLIYLLTKYPDIYLNDLFVGENKLYSILHKFYNIFNLRQSKEKYFLLKSIYYILTTISRRLIVLSTNFDDKNFDKLMNNPLNTIAIMDLTDSDFLYKMIRSKINTKGVRNYAFHHAFNIISNYLTTYKHLERKKQVPIDASQKYADTIFMYNSFAIQHINDLFLCKKEQLPSLRYSSRWIENLKKNREIFSTSDDKAYKLKIVFMLTHVDYNVWKEELFRTIQMLLLNSKIYLVVKVHPRSIKEKNKFLKLQSNNFQVVANDVSSSSLIDWSNVVMTISSGIVMEAIIKRKTIFYMKYLHCNQIEPEKTRSIIYKIETRDQLIDLLNLYIENKNQNYIDEHEVKEFLKDYIGNDDYEENCMMYLKLFQDIK